jgi:cytochrome c-type biogenesis protein CcmH/NrfG
MKFAGLFTKTPNHKRFNYVPRHFDPREEEFRERQERIMREVEAGLKKETDIEQHRSRIKGSFQHARKRSIQKSAPSAAVLRTLITLFIVIELWAYLQFGNKALYGLFLIVPFYLFLRLRGFKKS